MLSTRGRLLTLLALLGLPFALAPMPAQGVREKQAAPAVGQGGKEKWAPAPGDWPLFRGNPLQTGVASSALPADLVVRWKFKTKDSIEAAAAIVNGVVYAGSFDEHLYALDLATGKEK